jgi:hypothetical protein
MTEAEWLRSDAAGAMLDYLWQQRGVSPPGSDLRFGGDVRRGDAPPGVMPDLGRAHHRYYLVSCRGI